MIGSITGVVAALGGQGLVGLAAVGLAAVGVIYAIFTRPETSK